MVTFEAPHRREQRAASSAVLPPPTTATISPTFTFAPAFTSFRKSMPESTLGWSSPGMRRLRPFHAPMAITTASFSARSFSSVTSVPSRTPVRSVAPMLTMSAMAASSTLGGSR